MAVQLRSQRQTNKITRGSTVYLPFILRYLYDLVVLGFYCSYVWRCPAHKLSALYSTQIEAAISRRHRSRATTQNACFNPPLRLLDIGVGTGYHLAHAPLLPPRSQLVLADLNQHCLDAASARAAETHKDADIFPLMADFLEPSEEAELCLSRRRLASLDGRGHHPAFDIITCTFLLHCLPGPPSLKAEALTRLGSRLLAKDGVLTGATILGDGAPHNLLGRFILMWHNLTGVFSNRHDDVDTFVKGLEKVFETIEWEVVGVVFIFKASGVKNAKDSKIN